MRRKTKEAFLKNRRTKGIALVWSAIMLLTLILFTGISIDVARVYLVANQLQNAADAAALAGAQVVKYDQQDVVIARVIAIAGANYAGKLPVAVAENTTNDPNGEVVLGKWIRQLRQFFPTTISPDAVKVRANRPGLMGADAPAVSLIFGPIAHVDTANVSRYATAVSTGSEDAGIFTLADNPKLLPGWHNETGLLMDGGTTVDLRGFDPVTGEPMVGDIQVNASSTDSPWAGFRLNGSSANIYAGEFNVVGSTNPSADDIAKWQSLYGDPSLPFSVNPSSPSLPDPLAGLTPPTISTMPLGHYIDNITGEEYVSSVDKPISNGDWTLNPGYYPGGINTSGGTITLIGGSNSVYAFGGGTKGDSGMVLGGTSSLVGNGVMCYVTGDPNGAVTGTKVPYGQISMQGTGTLQLTSRGDAMTPAEINGEMGVVIWQDRDNTNYGTISGTVAKADSFIEGVIYCGYNAMKITGTPNQTGSQLIVGALELGGNISLGIAYDGRNTIEATQSYLVE